MAASSRTADLCLRLRFVVVRLYCRARGRKIGFAPRAPEAAVCPNVSDAAAIDPPSLRHVADILIMRGPILPFAILSKNRDHGLLLADRCTRKIGAYLFEDRQSLCFIQEQ